MTAATKSKPKSLQNRGSLEPFIKDEVLFYDHQIEGIRKLWKKKSFILADDMGLGKSVQALAIYGMRLWIQKRDGHKLGHMLVVCPVSLKHNWANEIEKFTRFNYLVLEGTPAMRNRQLAEYRDMEGPKVLIVNYEQIKPHLKEINELKFDMVAADEAHYLKNYKAQRTKAFQKIVTNSHMMLTGTPLLNNPSELWVMLDRVAPGKWGTYWQFVRRHCTFGGFEGKQITGAKNEAELRQKMSPIMLRRLKSEVLDLPDVQTIVRPSVLHPEQRKVYNEIVEDLRIHEMEGDDGEQAKKIDNALVRYLRLKQVCGTLATVLGPDRDVSAKLDLAMDDMETFVANDKKVVVFTQFKGVLRAYKSRIEKAHPNVKVFELHGEIDKADRQDIINEWSAAKGAAVIIGTFPVMSVGYNLVAAHTMQFLDKDYVPAINKQAVDRCNRIGASTTQPVQVYEYLAKGTAEERIEKLLEHKVKINEAIIERKTAPTFSDDMLEILKMKAE